MSKNVNKSHATNRECWLETMGKKSNRLEYNDSYFCEVVRNGPEVIRNRSETAAKQIETAAKRPETALKGAKQARF